MHSWSPYILMPIQLPKTRFTNKWFMKHYNLLSVNFIMKLGHFIRRLMRIVKLQQVN